jgi:hypothetical protein
LPVLPYNFLDKPMTYSGRVLGFFAKKSWLWWRGCFIGVFHGFCVFRGGKSW